MIHFNDAMKDPDQTEDPDPLTPPVTFDPETFDQTSPDRPPPATIFEEELLKLTQEQRDYYEAASKRARGAMTSEQWKAYQSLSPEKQLASHLRFLQENMEAEAKKGVHDAMKHVLPKADDTERELKVKSLALKLILVIIWLGATLLVLVPTFAMLWLASYKLWLGMLVTGVSVALFVATWIRLQGKKGQSK